MQTDSRSQSEEITKKAEAFIENVVAPLRRGEWDADPDRSKVEFDSENGELARQELAAAGFDVERLDKLVKERGEKRKKLAEDARRNAVDASAAARERLAGLAVNVPLDMLDTVIDEMTSIRSFIGQGQVLDWNIAPSDNWARYRLDGSGDSITQSGTGRLSFFAIWQNKQNSPTTIVVQPQLIVNAYLWVDVDGAGVAAWFFPDPVARASVRARTTVWSMDSNVGSIVHDQVLAGTAGEGGFFGDYASASVEYNGVLSATGVVIPAQAYTLIEVELLTEWVARHASVILDAEYEDASRRVDVPQIILTEFRTPEPPALAPISLTAGVDTGVTPARVTLIFSGANGSLVDIYQNGSLLGNTENDGVWSFEPGPGTYTYRVCELQSQVCSTEVTVTVP